MVTGNMLETNLQNVVNLQRLLTVSSDTKCYFLQ
jgi:hypothetical protein